MDIKDIQARMGKIEVEGRILSVEPAREFEKFGNKGKVANAEMEDSSGKIKLTLWNEDVDKVKVGDTVKITNGYCGEFQGEKQLTAGRFGKLEVNGEGSEEKKEDSKE